VVDGSVTGRVVGLEELLAITGAIEEAATGALEGATEEAATGALEGATEEVATGALEGATEEAATGTLEGATEEAATGADGEVQPQPEPEGTRFQLQQQLLPSGALHPDPGTSG
jgi:hypothetical protein